MRTAALAAPAAAAILLLTAPSAVAATVDISNLPDAVTIGTNDRIAVSDARTVLCGSGSLSVLVPGTRDAVRVSDVSCDGRTLNATITPTDSTKTTSVVKFRLRKDDGSLALLTLVVRVDR